MRECVSACGVRACVCVSHLCVAREAGPDDAGQQFAVYGCGRDDLGRGHGGDALQSLLFSTVVLGRHVNRISTGIHTHHVLPQGNNYSLSQSSENVMI